MKVVETRLPGVKLIEPRVFSDDRGFFMEIFQAQRYAELAGIDRPFVQDNLSFSRYGVLRGLHFQNPNPQGKLVYVLQGEVFDVAVDIRRGSPTFGQWFGTLLSAENKRQMWIPEGFAHGFCVTTETALFTYKCTANYSAQDDGAIRWNDPAIGIEWPISDVQLSEKDLQAPTLETIDSKRLFDYGHWPA